MNPEEKKENGFEATIEVIRFDEEEEDIITSSICPIDSSCPANSTADV